MSKRIPSHSNVELKDGKAIVTNPIAILFMSDDGQVGTAWLGNPEGATEITTEMVAFVLAVQIKSGALIAGITEHELLCHIARELVEMPKGGLKTAVNNVRSPS